MQRILLALIGLIFMAPSVHAEDYWIAQYRAAPGKLPELLEFMKSTDWQLMNGSRPIVMRHSQGNHWDLMLLGNYRVICENDMPCAQAGKTFRRNLRNLVDFELVFDAVSETRWENIQNQDKPTHLYHIEMFNAAAGKHDALLQQRHMENNYLAKTGQTTNVIFTVGMGSDVDVFTIGFHESLTSFAQSPDLPSDMFEKAAVEAGFKNRADISFHLRELIVGHHDTLATKVE